MPMICMTCESQYATDSSLNPISHRLVTIHSSQTDGQPCQ